MWKYQIIRWKIWTKMCWYRYKKNNADWNFWKCNFPLTKQDCKIKLFCEKNFFGFSLLNGNWQFLIILNQNGLWDFDTSFKRLFWSQVYLSSKILLLQFIVFQCLNLKSISLISYQAFLALLMLAGWFE